MANRILLDHCRCYIELQGPWFSNPYHLYGKASNSAVRHTNAAPALLLSRIQLRRRRKDALFQRDTHRPGIARGSQRRQAALGPKPAPPNRRSMNFALRGQGHGEGYCVLGVCLRFPLLTPPSPPQVEGKARGQRGRSVLHYPSNSPLGGDCLTEAFRPERWRRSTRNEAGDTRR